MSFSHLVFIILNTRTAPSIIEKLIKLDTTFSPVTANWDAASTPTQHQCGVVVIATAAEINLDESVAPPPHNRRTRKEMGGHLRSSKVNKESVLPLESDSVFP